MNAGLLNVLVDNLAHAKKTYLVRGLVELLGVERQAETEREAWAQQRVVGERSNAAVVYLGLKNGPVSYDHRVDPRDSLTFTNEDGSRRYLLATSRPTLLPALESQVALAPASTSELTLW